MTQTAMWAIGILITLITVTFIILGFAFGRLKETTDRADNDRADHTDNGSSTDAYDNLMFS